MGELIYKSQELLKTSIQLQKSKNKIWMVNDVPLVGAGPNDNFFYFTPEELEKSYQGLEGVPLIVNKLGTIEGDHADYSSMNCVGHVYNVKYDKDRAIIYGDLEITDPTVGEKIERKDSRGKPEIDGVSIGSYVDKVMCNICNGNMNNCGHVRGEEYDGRVAYGFPEGIKFEHLAMTSFPAWKHAKFSNKEVMVVEAQKKMVAKATKQVKLEKEGKLPEDESSKEMMKEVFERLNKVEGYILKLMEEDDEKKEVKSADEKKEEAEDKKEEANAQAIATPENVDRTDALEKEKKETVTSPQQVWMSYSDWPAEVMKMVDDMKDMAVEEIVAKLKENGYEVALDDVLAYMKDHHGLEAQETMADSGEEEGEEAEMSKAKRAYIVAELKRCGVKVTASTQKQPVKVLMESLKIAREAYRAKLQVEASREKIGEGMPFYDEPTKVDSKAGYKKPQINLSHEEIVKAIKEQKGISALLQERMEGKRVN